MTTTFAYDIMSLASDVHTGVVSSVQFSIRAKSVNGISSRGVCDAVDLSPPGDVFIKLEALTQADVASWLEDQLHPDKLTWLKEYAKECLAEVVNPKLNKALPWLTTN
jgi:hypothetical protein